MDLKQGAIRTSGQAEVFDAYDYELGRKVVLKRISTRGGISKQAVEKEICMLRQAQGHPAIVKLLGFQHDARFSCESYIVSKAERIANLSLRLNLRY